MVSFSRAQAGLEYLMTYGWALVLIVTVVSVLFFVFSSPASTTRFSSSDPTKILLRTGNISGTNAEIQLQNATGGKIQITAITPTNYNNCTVNGSASSISVGGGSVMKLNCTAPSDNKGSIKIEYTDFAGLQRTVIINGSGTGTTTGGCTDGEARNCPLQFGVCSGAQETCTGGAWPGCNSATYLSHNPNYEETEASCTDALDNDCDGNPDCVDATDCGSDPACGGAIATLVAYYKAEGNAADSSGTGNNGVWFGTPAYQAGVSGQAFDFPGTSETGIAVADSPSLDLTTGVTLAAWVYRRSHSDHHKVMIKPYDMFNTEPWELYSLDFKCSASSSCPCFLISTGLSGGEDGACGSNTVPLNEWHHIAGTYDGSTAKVFSDGQLVGTLPMNITIGTNNEAFYINGVQGQSFHIDGLTDEVKVYNGALTGAEVCAVCNEFKPVGATCNC